MMTTATTMAIRATGLFPILPKALQGKNLYSNFIHKKGIQLYLKTNTTFFRCSFSSCDTLSLNVSLKSHLGLKVFNFNTYQGKININRCYTRVRVKVYIFKCFI